MFRNAQHFTYIPIAVLETPRECPETISILENEDEELPRPETVNIFVEDDLIDNPDISLGQEELPPPETVNIFVEDDLIENPDVSLGQGLFSLDEDPLSVVPVPEPSSNHSKNKLKPDPEVIKIESSDDDASDSEAFNRCEPEDDGYRSASDEGTGRQKTDSSHSNSSDVQIIASKKVASDKIEKESTKQNSAIEEGTCKQKVDSSPINSSEVQIITCKKVDYDKIELVSKEQNSTVEVGIPGEGLNPAVHTNQGGRTSKGRAETRKSASTAPGVAFSLETATLEPVVGKRQSSRASKEWAKIRMQAVLSRGVFFDDSYNVSDQISIEAQNKKASKEWAKVRIRMAVGTDGASLIADETNKAVDSLIDSGQQQTVCVSEQMTEVQMSAALSAPDVISCHKTVKNDCHKESAAIHNLLLSGNIKRTMQVVLTRCPEAERLIQSMKLSRESLRNKRDVQNELQVDQTSSNKLSMNEISMKDVNNFQVEKVPNVRLVKSHDTAEWQVTPVTEISNSLKRCKGRVDITTHSNLKDQISASIVRKDTSLRAEQGAVGESDEFMSCKIDAKNTSTVLHNNSSQHNNSEKGAGLQSLKCTDCNMQFTSVASLNGHIPACVQSLQKVQNVKYSSLTCKLCGKTLSSRFRLKYHTAIHKSSPRFKCRICGKNFFFIYHLKEHYQNHVKKISYECEICEKSFATEKALKCHRNKKHHVVLTHLPRMKNSSANPDSLTSEVCHILSSSDLTSKKVQLSNPLQNGQNLQSSVMSSEHENLHKKQFIEHNGSAPTSINNIREGLQLTLKEVNSANSLHSHNILNNKSVFNCGVCGKIFPTILKLSLHQCVLGKLTPQSLEDEKSHLSSNCKGLYKSRKQWPCALCGKVLSSQKFLKRHLNAHKNRKPFVCQVCNKVFSGSYRLKLHSNIHTGGKSLMCDLCKRTYYSPSGLRRHRLKFHRLKVMHKPRFFCPVCGKSFSHEQQLQEHQCKNSAQNEKEVHWEKQPTINVTEKVQTNTLSLKYSLPLHKGTPFQCNFCDRIFKTSQRLEDHTRSRHTFERPYQCDACSKTFCSTDALRVHKSKSCNKKKSTLVLHLRPYKCATCDAAFNINSDLKKHIELHHATKVYVAPELDSQSTNKEHTCDQCLGSYSSRYALQKHVSRVHVNVRTDGAFKCDHCARTFTKRGYLRRHKSLLHSEFQQKAKKFKYNQNVRSSYFKATSSKHCVTCEQCGRVFANRGRFNQHKCWVQMGNVNESSTEKSFSKEQKYKCNQCDAEFIARHALLRHKKRFHFRKKVLSSVLNIGSLKNSHKCGFCNVSFMHASSINRHVQKYHQNKIKAITSNDSSRTTLESYAAFHATSMSQEHSTKLGENVKNTFANRSVTKFYPCNLCNANYRWKGDLARHKRNYHEERHYPTITPNHGENVKNTFANRFVRRLYSCNLCNANYRWKGDLVKHKRIRHEEHHYPTITPKHGENVKHTNHPVRKFYSCNICSSKYLWMSNLVRHKRAHHEGNKQNECSVSSIKLSPRSELSNHCEKSLDEQCHSCALCGESFKVVKDLKDHMLVHTTQLSSFRCDICFVTFSTAADLKLHMYNHVQNKLHGINSMEKTSTAAVNVSKTTKRKRLLKSRSYKCEVCRKVYQSMGSLKLHKMLHSGERPYVCEICGSGFRERCKLFLHVVKEHGNIDAHVQTVKQMFKRFMTYKCDSCGKSFARRGNFERHLCVNMTKENSVCN